MTPSLSPLLVFLHHIYLLRLTQNVGEAKLLRSVGRAREGWGLRLMSMLNVVRKSTQPWKTAVLTQLLLMYAGRKVASGSKIDWQSSASSYI